MKPCDDDNSSGNAKTKDRSWLVECTGCVVGQTRSKRKEGSKNKGSESLNNDHVYGHAPQSASYRIPIPKNGHGALVSE